MVLIAPLPQPAAATTSARQSAGPRHRWRIRRLVSLSYMWERETRDADRGQVGCPVPAARLTQTKRRAQLLSDRVPSRKDLIARAGELLTRPELDR